MKLSLVTLSSTALCLLALSSPSAARDIGCITKDRLNELQSGKWAKYHFSHRGRQHWGKTKYMPDGRVFAVSRGKNYNRGTWKVKNGYVLRHAPDRPGDKNYKLKIRSRC